MTDPIADMLTRVRNAIMARKHSVTIPYSRMKSSIAQILKSEGWVGSVETVGEIPHQSISITLLYGSDGRPVLSHIKRLSTSGRRWYVKKDAIPTVLNRFGMAIISTPQGVMSDREARKRGIGGELLCEIY